MTSTPRAEHQDAQSSPNRIPSSTYRLQFNENFTFDDALEVTDYLHQLGISDCYSSPIFTACPGSSHGYDVCDSSQINPGIGSEADFDRWSEHLRRLRMGLVLDIVPNHMGANPLNPWWWDVLQNGVSSPFAQWFDIEWAKSGLRGPNKVILAILEDHYWKVLESGKLRVVEEAGGLMVHYHQHRLPLAPDSTRFLQNQIPRMTQETGILPGALQEPNALKHLFANGGPSQKSATAKHSRGELKLEDRPRGECGEAQALEKVLKRINGTVGQPRSFDFLHALLEQQNYQLAYWRTANEMHNYRRFFDINDLVALRMELPEVFEASHQLVLRLVREGKVTGLRVDHPDGLWNPKEYFERLQNAGVTARCAEVESRLKSENDDAAANARNGSSRNGSASLYVVAEKILTEREPLPTDWAVSGTTGYEFLNLLNGLFVNEANRLAMDEVYREFVGNERDFLSLVHQSKLKILRTSMSGDLHTLTTLLQSIARRTRYGIDFNPSDLDKGLAAIVAGFPVYRTYLTERSETPTPEERAQIELAVRRASGSGGGGDADTFSFIEALLQLRFPEDLDAAGRKDCRRFVLKFQQLTGPVMAKGLEDTAFYNYNRFVSLNEVGGAPDQFGTSLTCFHEQNQIRAADWPNTLLATATHDTKRGEDLRARLNVLSEIPEQWRQTVHKWRALNAGNKSVVDRQPAPDANDEYLLYQTLVGAWDGEAANGYDSSDFRTRISAYMLKAVRESKAHTSWTDSNQPYEEAVQNFVQRLLTPSNQNQFLDDFMLFQRKVAFFGLFNSLAQIVLKMTVPGVPDFYQGTELWDYNLVDPDNRRPVDYNLRKTLLAELREKFSETQADTSGLIKALLKNYQTGQIKLYFIWRVLELRQRRRKLFECGDYVPMPAEGPNREHVCAFARTHAGATVITVAPRLIVGLTKGTQRGALESDVWQETSLPIPESVPRGRYLNVLTRQALNVQPGGGSSIPEILGLLPVAVLERCD